MATAAENHNQPIDAEEEQAFMDAIQKWIDRSVKPVVMEHDHEDKWPEQLVGEMADELLITGQRVLPANLLNAGYTFQYPELEEALSTLV